MGYKGGDKDPLIGLGTGPLDDPLFRAAVFEQLGEQRLEGAVTTDVAGRPGPTRFDSTRRRGRRQEGAAPS